MKKRIKSVKQFGKRAKTADWTRELFLSLVAISLGVTLHFIHFHLNHSKIFKLASKQSTLSFDLKSLNLESLSFSKVYSFNTNSSSSSYRNHSIVTENWLCPFDLAQKIDLEKITPIHQLNPDKFLLGIFPFGPSNQLHGFRDTILMAIFLNRTLVLQCVQQFWSGSEIWSFLRFLE